MSENTLKTTMGAMFESSGISGVTDSEIAFVGLDSPLARAQRQADQIELPQSIGDPNPGQRDQDIRIAATGAGRNAGDLTPDF